MKKIALLSIVFPLLFTLQSCKNGVAKIVLNEDLDYVVDVYGGEDDFFQPVAGKYSVIDKDGSLQVTIEFEKTKRTKSNKYSVEEFILSPTDKTDHYIKLEGESKKVSFQAENSSQVAHDLLNAKVGDKVKVTFTYVYADKQVKKSIIEKIYSCGVDLTLYASID